MSDREQAVIDRLTPPTVEFLRLSRRLLGTVEDDRPDKVAQRDQMVAHFRGSLTEHGLVVDDLVGWVNALTFLTATMVYGQDPSTTIAINAGLVAELLGIEP